MSTPADRCASTSGVASTSGATAQMPALPFRRTVSTTFEASRSKVG